jgi:hypothetical protein
MRKTWGLIISLLVSPAPPVAAGDASERAVANPLARAPLESYVQTLQRPLFSSTRRPPPRPAPAVRSEPQAAPPPDPPGVALVGVVSNERGRRAFIQPGPSEKLREVKVGDEIGGWTVTEIAQRRVVLALGTRTSAYALFETKSRLSRTAARKKGRR